MSEYVNIHWIEEVLSTQAMPKLPSDDVRKYLLDLPEALKSNDDPFERAVLGACFADRVAFASVCGHQAAMRRLVPGLAHDSVVAFCASEEGGAHPKAIKTTLAESEDGFVMTGQKRWATLSPAADQLLVVASVGWKEERNQLKVALVPSSRAGIKLRVMPPSDFSPEMTHAEIDFTEVKVAPEEILPGDGYLAAVKPFRTIEDVLIAASVLTYNLRLAAAWDWPQEAQEELLVLLVAARELTRQDPSSPGHHLAVAGWNRLSNSVRESHRSAGLWQSVPDEIDSAFVRDTSGSVAAKAKELRRQAAWRSL